MVDAGLSPRRALLFFFLLPPPLLFVFLLEFVEEA